MKFGKLGLVGVLGAVGMLGSGVTFAQTATTTLSVTANVTKVCTVSTTAVAFGEYFPLGTHATNPLNGTGTVVVTCTKGTVAPTIGLDVGLNDVAGQRYMADGANTLLYNIYKPSANTQPPAACAYIVPWGDSGGDLFTLPNAPSKAARTYNVCGQIPAGEDPAAGAAYSDTVNVTVTY